MIIITTSSSISVKPPAAPAVRLPIMVADSVQALAWTERVHVVDIVARLRIVGSTGVTAQSPSVLPRHGAVGKKRIARHAPQEGLHHFPFARHFFEAHVEGL